MSKTRSNPDFLNGVPELVVLKLLSRRPMYGYELVRAIEAASEHSLAFGEGCIYPVLHKLEQDGLLASSRENVGGRERIVYRVTRSGTNGLDQSVAAWRNVVAGVGKILAGGEYGSQRAT
jgi:PadR family transcriptional regulator, regulatory protein PadR